MLNTHNSKMLVAAAAGSQRKLQHSQSLGAAHFLAAYDNSVGRMTLTAAHSLLK